MDEHQKAFDNAVRLADMFGPVMNLGNFYNQVVTNLAAADRIFVIDQGGILEQGSPAELMARKGHYYELYMAQFHS